MNLSPHFTLAEFTASQTAARLGLKNEPPPDVVTNLEHTALGMEGVRKLLGAPIIVSSGYRSPEVNRAVGGARASQHTTGQACDFIAPGFGDPKDVARAIVAAGIPFDQIIMEGSWVHISFTATPRKQALTAYFGNGTVRYTPGVL